MYPLPRAALVDETAVSRYGGRVDLWTKLIPLQEPPQ